MIGFQKECGHWERIESLEGSGSTLEQLEKGLCGECEKMKKCKSEDEAVAAWEEIMSSKVVYEVGEASDGQKKEKSKLVLVLPEGVKKVTYEW